MSRNARIQFVFLLLAGWFWPAAGGEYFSLRGTNSAARVVAVQGENLLDAFVPDERGVEQVFNRGLLALTGKTNVVAAWRSLVQTNDTVGIKVFSVPGPLSGTRPAVVAAMVRGLIAAGLPPKQIVIWDKHADDLQVAGFSRLGRQFGVRVAGAVDSGYDEKTFYLPDAPVAGTLVWTDLEFGKKGEGLGKKSFVSKLVSKELTKIISVAPLINENDAGVCGHLFSLTLGSVDNTRRFEGDPDRLAVALPEIYALPAVGDHVVLHVTDALINQYSGGPASYLQYATEPGELWFSHDPVALDTLSLRELIRARRIFNAPVVPVNYQIFTNAVLLQLGINDPARIQVERVK